LNPDEFLLTSNFEESVKIIKNNTSIDLSIVSYDWHKSLKHNGVNSTIETLWSLVGETLKNYGYNCGELTISDQKIVESKVTQKQNGLMRVNCADSLDRTNLCLYCK
jgi:hypothetical protein